MKQRICIVVLVLSLLLLTGCGHLSDSKEENAGSNTETLIPTKATASTEPAATTMPTQTVPTESITPTEPLADQLTAVSAGFEAVYADICHLLETGSWSLEYTYVNVGMVEVLDPQSTKEERYASLTYALEDLNGDGSTEMVVLDAMDNARILAIFTLQGGQPVMTHDGWYRSRLYRLSDGTFYHEGSSGAAYSIFEAYGQCWFTYPKGDEQLEHGYYYADDGIYDPETAREITAEEYTAKQAELTQMIIPFSVHSFC